MKIRILFFVVVSIASTLVFLYAQPTKACEWYDIGCHLGGGDNDGGGGGGGVTDPLGPVHR